MWSGTQPADAARRARPQFPTTGALAALEDLPGIRPVRRRRAFAPAGAPGAAPALGAMNPLTAPAGESAPAAAPPAAAAAASANPLAAFASAVNNGPGDTITHAFANGVGSALTNLIKAAGERGELPSTSQVLAGRRRLAQQGPPGAQQGPPRGPPNQQGPPQGQQGPPQGQQAPPQQLDPEAKFLAISPDVTVNYDKGTATINGGNIDLAGHKVTLPDLSGINLPAEPVLTVLRLIRDPTVLGLDREGMGLDAPAPAPGMADAYASAGASAPALGA